MTKRRAAPVVGAAAGLAAVLTGCSSSAPAPKAATSVGPSTATTSTQPTPASTVPLQRWYVATRPSLNRVDDSIIAAQKAVKRNDTSGLHDACLSLQQSVRRLAALAPAPDRRVKVSIRHANADFTAAAIECLANNLSTAGTSVLRGQRAVTIAAHRVDRLT